MDRKATGKYTGGRGQMLRVNLDNLIKPIDLEFVIGEKVAKIARS
jgi:hypothetical protein